MVNLKNINLRLLRVMASHPPKLIPCEICEGWRLCVRTDPHPLPGTRCLGCMSTAKHRGIYAVLCELFGRRLARLRDRSAYELSAHGALFNTLARLSVHTGFDLTCSEYMHDLPRGGIRNGVRSENVEALTFDDSSFDLITSTDVFEHVENDAAGFSEIARVLKPGGYFVFTVPYYDGATRERAVRLSDGSIQHLLPPEYHGDPMNGAAGVFTWRSYGQDICERLERANLSATVRHVLVSGTDMASPVVIANKTHST